MTATLEVIGLSKTYDGGAGQQVVALDGVTLSVKEGEFVSIVGPSGCGKTTLLNIIGGLTDDYDGKVLVEGKAVNGARRGIGMVFQEELTFPWRTTLDNVAFPLEVGGMGRAEREDKRAALRPPGRARRVRAPLSGIAFGRHAPAHGGGPRSRLRAAHHAVGRAVRRAGRADAHAARRQAPGDPRQAQPDHAAHHPFDHRGGAAFRSCGGA